MSLDAATRPRTGAATRPPEGGALLSVDGLVKHFGTGAGLLSQGKRVVRALDGVSFAVGAGETMALVGESGCGKSTLGRLILRLLLPTAGRVTFAGTVVSELSEAAMRPFRRRMQIVFQDPFASLNPRMTVGAILAEPLAVHGIGDRRERRARVEALLDLVGLSPQHLGRYPHEFSGGQRQRIGIARALVVGPELLIGDEPVSALDVSVRAQVINLLEDLKARLGLTLIVISHDLAVVRHMADRVGVMYLGKLVELAEADRLFAEPRHPYTQALMAALPVPAARRRRRHPVLQGDVPSPIDPPGGCRFHTRCPHARETCRAHEPLLEAGAAGHAVACHFWREIGAAALLDQPPPSAAYRRRLDLYQEARRRQERAAPRTAPSISSERGST